MAASKEKLSNGPLSDDEEDRSHKRRQDDDDDDDDDRRGDSEDIPEPVRKFVSTLQRRIIDKATHEIHNMYLNDFPKLSVEYFKNRKWPEPKHISASIVTDDPTFMLLYKELYFRHQNLYLDPSIDDRFDSFYNYVDLFNMFSGLNPSNPELELPNNWLWEMIDEFVYQFHSFQQLRARTDRLTNDDIAQLTPNEHLWSASIVTQLLIGLVKLGGVNLAKNPATASATITISVPVAPSPSLSSSGSTDEKKDDTAAGSSSQTATQMVQVPVPNFYKTLAQFALIGLCRVNALLSDYTSALRALEPIDLNSKRNPFSQVVSAHFALYYYMGLSYLMLRRYVDATKTLSSFLTYISRNDDGVPRQLMKRAEQMHGLLCMAVSLAPQRLNDTLQTALKDKFGDKLHRMVKGEISVYEEVYANSVPKFISATKANLALRINREFEAQKHQQRLFIADVSQRCNLPEIYSYLKLCTIVSVSKLGSFLKKDEATLTQELLSLKHKTRNMRWRPGGGGPLAGKLTSAAEVDFAINKDLISVAEYRSQRRYGDFFIRQILKLDDLIHDINHLDPHRV